MENNRKITRLFFWIIISGIVLVSIYRRLPGIGPYSLWLDDVWCAVLAKQGSIPFILTAGSPSPPGFILTLKLIGHLFGFSAFCLQILPLVASILQVFLLAYIVQKFIKMNGLSISAAILLAGNPTLARYSLSIKSFTLDGLIVLIILYLSVLSLEYKQKKYFILLSFFSALSVFVSFTSIFFSLFAVPLVHYELFHSLQNNKLRKIIAGSTAIYFLITFILVILFMGKFNPSLSLFWKDFYIPTEGFGNILAFVKSKGCFLFENAFFSNLQWMAILIPLGIWLLIRDKENRTVGYSVVLFYIAIFTASALRIYPVGGQRTDIFTYPISIFAAMMGGWFITRRFKVVQILFLIAVLIFYFAEVVKFPIDYPENSSRQTVELLNKYEKPGDTLIIFPWANWAVGFYSKWKPIFVKVNDSTNGFYVELNRPNTYVLRETDKGIRFKESPDIISSQLKFLKSHPPKVIYLATSVMPYVQNAHRWIIENITSKGYTIGYYRTYNDGCFMVLKR